MLKNEVNPSVRMVWLPEVMRRFEASLDLFESMFNNCPEVVEEMIEI